MAYERQTWECGETITAEKLNHMEEGISSASGGGTPLIVRYVSPEVPLDKTWQEIRNAQEAGVPVIFIDTTGDSVCTSSMIKTYISNDYVVLVRLFDSGNIGQGLHTDAFYAESADGELIID